MRHAPRHVVVISDLHLGGVVPCMMSRPQRLADFLASLAPPEGARLELVIAGDFVDFLAVPPQQAWTDDPELARQKLRDTLAGPFGPVFDALRLHLERGHELVVLIGNHDVELALPGVQDALLAAWAADPAQVRFVDDGRAWRRGELLVEHGNRYDPANQNDWSGLRAIVSAQTRNERAPEPLRASVGSALVERVVNPVKARYPFLDLLQPQGELVAWLILAFEPSLAEDLEGLRRLLRGAWAEGRNPRGLAPGETRHVSGTGPREDAELAAAFGPLYAAVHASGTPVGAMDWLGLFARPQADSLSVLIRDGRGIGEQRLRQIQVVLRRLLEGEAAMRWDGPPGPCGEAALRMVGGDLRTVVMGHTHQPRHLGDPALATYLNTGSWIDGVQVPLDALVDGPAGRAAMERFLHALFTDEARHFRPTWAEIRVEDGVVRSARLCGAEEERGGGPLCGARSLGAA